MREPDTDDLAEKMAAKGAGPSPEEGEGDEFDDLAEDAMEAFKAGDTKGLAATFRAVAALGRRAK
jgi:hypothetical protein